MNKFYLLTFFCFIFLFSTTALACDFCYVKNLTCPTIVQTNKNFTITFEFSGTGPTYPYQHVGILMNNKKIGCIYFNEEACEWKKSFYYITAPSEPGVYTYIVKCGAAMVSTSYLCGMDDDSASCTVNVVDEEISKI